MHTPILSRRSFCALLGATPFAARALTAEKPSARRVPIGLQMYSVRDDEKRDLMGTLQALRGMRYECVEFWAPYSDWTPDRAKEVRKQMDDLGLRCFSNHTGTKHFSEEHLPRVIELNQILGSRTVILSHAGPQTNLDGWRRTADLLSRASSHSNPRTWFAGITIGTWTSVHWRGRAQGYRSVEG